MTTVVGNRGQLWTSALSPHLLSPHLDFPETLGVLWGVFFAEIPGRAISSLCSRPGRSQFIIGEIFTLIFECKIMEAFLCPLARCCQSALLCASFC